MFLGSLSGLLFLRRFFYPREKDSPPPKDSSVSFLREAAGHLPHSSIWCTGTSRNDRICHVKNLYFDTDRSMYIFLNGQSSIIAIPTTGDDESSIDWQWLLDMSSLSDHNAFAFSLHLTSSTDSFEGKRLLEAGEKTFIFSRFHSGNIMHTIHDDFQGLFHLTRQSGSPENRHWVLLGDNHDVGEYAVPLQTLSAYPLQTKRSLPKSSIIRFSDATVGILKIATWYHYGFSTPQGPIPGKFVDGRHFKAALAHLSESLGIPEAPKVAEKIRVLKNLAFKEPVESSNFSISVFSRRSDRLILNEEELARSLEENFSLPVQFVRMEDHSLREQIEILQRSLVVIGMHGSLLVMAGFMTPGSLLLEAFPYAVPGANYTPYKTMCSLPGVRIAYRTWCCTDPGASVSHPERSPLQGGISHLSQSEQLKITGSATVPPHLCCTNPYWLFRIFQDTRVDCTAVNSVLRGALVEMIFLAEEAANELPLVIPTPVTKIQGAWSGDDHISLSWEKPWNVASESRLEYGVWSHTHYAEYKSTSTSIEIPQCEKEKSYDFWVRVYWNGKALGYSKKFTLDPK